MNKRTQEFKDRMSKIIKQKYANGKVMGYQKGHVFHSGTKLFVKGQVPWNKNKTYCNPSEAGENHYSKRPGFVHFRKGKKLSASHYEALKKAGLWNKGKKAWNKGIKGRTNTGRTHFKKGISPWNKNKKLPQFSKENSPHWKGGISFEPYPFEFNKQIKERVRVRDNFKCQLCGVPQLECKQLHCSHHIDYDKKNCKIDNLILLCHKCHAYTNYNRNFWIKWFKENWHKETLEFIGSHLFQKELDKQATLKQGERKI